MTTTRPTPNPPLRGRTKLTRLKIISAIIFTLVLYNEWFSFMMKSYSWPQLPQTLDDKAVKILIVADPQILSVQTEPNFPFNYVAVWDANRFVSRTFHMSLTYAQPDIIVFLGDLINDGSVSSNDDFYELVETFKKLLYIPPSVKHVFYLPGDNDIGGEGYDHVSLNKIRRFNKAFNTSTTLSYKFVTLYHLNIIPGVSEATQHTFPSESSKTKLRILFSHLPVIPGARKSVIDQIHTINPSLIFSAHDHDSYKFIGKKSAPKADQFWVLREEGKVWHMKLSGEELHEVSVPTCSYRMGKEKYGFGVALVSEDGLLDYTIFWLPSRFSQLWCYFWGLCLCVAMLIFPVFFYISEKLNRIKTQSPPQQKYHRV